MNQSDQLIKLISSKGQMDKEASVNLLERTLQSILDELLKGVVIEIPHLGCLQVRSLPERRTVFFKQGDFPCQSIPEGISSVVLDSITELLDQGTDVSLSELGAFHTFKKGDGQFRVSFTPAVSLRKKLNAGKEIQEIQEEKEKEGFELLQEDNEKRVPIEPIKEQSMDQDKLNPSRPVISTENRTRIVSDQKKTGSTYKKVPRWILVSIVSCMVVWALILIFNSKDDTESKEGRDAVCKSLGTVGISISSKESTNLLDLAEKSYGNKIFWVYLYDANKEKLASPISIPVGTELKIPNLQIEYNIDPNDSLEIKRANILAEKLLKETK